jgi:hypothetical protein
MGLVHAEECYGTKGTFNFIEQWWTRFALVFRRGEFIAPALESPASIDGAADFWHWE